MVNDSTMHQRNSYRRSIKKPATFLKLKGTFDVSELAAEVESARLQWMQSQWKWHIRSEFCVLRAGPGGDPGTALTSGADIDQPVLDRLPRLRAALNELFPAKARLAWLGRLPPNTWIHLHTDNTEHWDTHHRVHLPLITNPAARLCLGARFLHLPLQTAWILNNSQPHGAINEGQARIHLMLDLPPSPEVEALIGEATPVAGEHDPTALNKLRRDPLELLSDHERQDPKLMRHFLAQ